SDKDSDKDSATDKANEAAYAAVLSYQQHLDYLRKGSIYPGQPVQPPQDDSSPAIQQWKQRAVDSMLRFASTFEADPRSAQVWLSAGEYLYSLMQYPRTVEVLQAMVAATTAADINLKKSAYGLMAQSHFNLNDFQQAEDNFLNQRNLIAPNTPEYQQVTEKLATSIYKKSEATIESGDKAAAITQLLTIKQLAPNSPIRITAQYDAASLLLDQQRWPEAIVEWQELQTLYPNHELAVEYPRKLAFAYEKNGDWQQAATTYLSLVDTDTDADIKQEALFLAATMFEKDQHYALAADNFTAYAERYKQPFDRYMEALYGAAINHERLGEAVERNKWLVQIIQADARAGDKASSRSRWLAAWSNATFGDFYAQRFNATTLSLPIVKSIPQKNTWLQQSVEYYQLAADYGILEFVTMSSYKIGVLYRQFASDLRNSPVPQNLSADNQLTYAAILEEQAAPFDQLAIDVHQLNLERAWAGQFNRWINKSFAQMRILIPERFKKDERIVSYGDGLR
ncbi:MAG: tetratricopeptide repeat protein, partial [Pseudomonadota bacterium]